MRSYCKNCQLYVETKEGYYYDKCVHCDSPVKKETFNKIKLTAVLCFIATILLLSLSLSSASPVDINPFSSNPANGSTVNSRYVNLGWNITSVNPLSTILFNWNNTNYSLYDDSLVLYYNFDNRSSLGENQTIFMSNTKYSRNATNNGTIYINGKYNYGLKLNGINNSIILDNSTDLINPKNGTVCMWFNVTGNGSATTSYLWSTNLNVRNRILFNYDSLTIGANFGSPNNFPNSATIELNKWYHTCLVWVTYNATANNITLYLDSKIVGSSIANNTDEKATRIRLGMLDSGVQFFNGTIDELVIYNKSLSEIEIRNIRNINLNKYNNSNYDMRYNNSESNLIIINYNLLVNDSIGNFNISNLNIYHNYITNTISNNQLKYILNSQYYGTNTHGIYGSNLSFVDVNDDGFRDILSNYSWHRDMLLASKIKILRADMGLSSSSINVTSFNETAILTTYGNINSQIDMVRWAYENNLTMLYIASYTPTWLQNRTNGYCNSSDWTRCTPYNYTLWGQMVLNWINKVTKNGTYASAVQIEVWNEPTSSTFWLNNLTDTSANADIRSLEYNKLYNATYQAIKVIYPNMKVGGGAFVINDNLAYPIMTRNFITNFTNMFDFISYHDYGSANDLNIGARFLNNQLNLRNNCTTLGTSCNNIYFDEYNYRDSTIKNTTSQYNLYRSNIALLLFNGINYYGDNLTTNLYQWSEQYKYNNTAYYPEYPQRWSMVSEPQLDNAIYTTYSLIANLTRYVPSNSNIYNCSSNNINLQCIISKINNACSISYNNNESEPQNVSVSFDTSLCGSQLIDTSNGNLISNGSTVVLEAYDVKYLTTPVITYDNNFNRYYSNYLGELIYQDTIPSSGQATCVNSSYGEILVAFIPLAILLAVIGLIIFIVVGEGNLTPEVLIGTGFVLVSMILVLGMGAILNFYIKGGGC